MLAALMRNITSHLVRLASICLVLLAACTGDTGTTCFQTNECNGLLICCHVGSPFTQGSCETQEVCDELQGGAGGTGGFGGAAGAGGAAGGGGQGGEGGAAGGGGQGGEGGAAGQGGQGGQGGAGGQAGDGGSAGMGGAGGGI